MPFAHDQKETTVVLYEIGKGAREKPVYQRAGFNFVSYDGDPDRYVEPVNASTEVDTVGVTHVILSATSNRERIVGFEFYRGRALEVHGFSPDNVQF